MAKRKRENNEKQNEKKRKEGRGQGNFENYKPWLKIQDVGSKGLSTRIKGWKTNRIHHFLSKLELSYFYLLEWSQEVLDIREQFPLYIEETIAIAGELGIKHPTDPKTQELVVMTTDFLVTVKQPIDASEMARTIKYAKNLSNKRTIEKFEIERVYWQNRGIDWAIVTEQDINSIIVENIKNLHFYRDKQNLPSGISAQLLKKAHFFITETLAKETLSLGKATSLCDDHLKIAQGTSLAIFCHLLANHRLTIDITQSLNPRRKIILQNLIQKGGQI